MCLFSLSRSYRKRLTRHTKAHLLDDLNARTPVLRPLLRPRRADGGHRSECPVEGEVEVDLPGSAAPIEPELPVLGPEDVAIPAPVWIEERLLLQDPRRDQVVQRARVLARGVVENADAALQGG